MSVTGYQLVGSNVTPLADRRMYEHFSRYSNYVMEGCDVSVSGSNFVIASGYGMTKGCFFSVSNETLAISSPQSVPCYGALALTINVSANTAEFDVLWGTSEAYPTLTQEDINSGGVVYQMEFARFQMTMSGLQGFRNTFRTDPNADKTTRTLLWTNPNPNNNISSVTTILNDVDLTIYDGFEVTYSERTGVGSPCHSTGCVATGVWSSMPSYATLALIKLSEMLMTASGTSSDSHPYARNINISNNKIEVGTCTRTDTSAAAPSALIPLKIVGYQNIQT